MSRSIQEKASSGLYRGLAELTQVVLARDAAWLMSQLPAAVGASATVH